MEKTSITLLYPNDTNVFIHGDYEVVKQIIEQLDGQFIGFIKPAPKPSDRTDTWDKNALKKFLDGKKEIKR